MRRILLLITHLAMFAGGFALGVYLLPILTAPPSVDSAKLEEMAAEAVYTAQFTKELRGSDFLHWGEGTVSITPTMVVHQGKMAPGPDYKMYLVPEFVEHEDEFEPLKAQSVQIGDVKTFDGVIVEIPDGVDIEAYTTILVWCEAFGEFITSVQYREAT